jgi:hypothetical protein
MRLAIFHFNSPSEPDGGSTALLGSVRTPKPVTKAETFAG